MNCENTSTWERAWHFAVGLTVIVVSYSETLMAIRFVVTHLLAPVTWL